MVVAGGRLEICGWVTSVPTWLKKDPSKCRENPQWNPQFQVFYREYLKARRHFQRTVPCFFFKSPLGDEGMVPF